MLSKSSSATALYPVLMILSGMFVLQNIYVAFSSSSYRYLFAGVSGFLSMILISVSLQDCCHVGFFLGYAFALKGAAAADFLLLWIKALEWLNQIEHKNINLPHPASHSSNHYILPFNYAKPSDVILTVIRRIDQFSLVVQYLAGGILLLVCCAFRKSFYKSSHEKEFVPVNCGTRLCCALLFICAYGGLMICSGYLYIFSTIYVKITLEVISLFVVTLNPIVWNNYNKLVLASIISAMLAVLLTVTCSSSKKISNYCRNTTLLTLTFLLNLGTVICVKFKYFPWLEETEGTPTATTLLLTTTWLLILVILNPYSHMSEKCEEKSQAIIQHHHKDKQSVPPTNHLQPEILVHPTSVPHSSHPVPVSCNLPGLTPVLVPHQLRYATQAYDTRNMYLV